MIKWLALVLIIKGLISCGDANADGSPTLAVTPSGDLVSVETVDNSETAGNKIVWVKIKTKKVTILARQEIACRHDSHRIIGIVVYGRDGSLKERKIFTGDWTLAAPGSADYKVMEYSCATTI